MSIHLGGRKIRELHYGRRKIREAYFGATKVYSSGPPTVYRLIGVWRQAWRGNKDEIRYQPGEIVTQNDTHYVARQPAANQEPSTSPEYWKPISGWSSGSQYRRRDIVLHYGVPWLATAAHTASSSTMPGVDRNSWKLISRGGVGR